MLVASALLHRMQNDDPVAYRQSNLIIVELITLVVSALSALGHFVLVICFLIQREFKLAMITFAVFVALILAVIVALWADAPTLLHMT